MRAMLVMLGLFVATEVHADVKPRCPRGTTAISERGDHSDDWDLAYGTLHGCKRGGTLDGAVVIEGATITRGKFVRGKREGVWASSWPDGKPARVLRYRAGIAHGATESWLKTGEPSERGQYTNGVMTGVWTYYLNGAPSNRIDYDVLHPAGVTCPSGTSVIRRRLPGRDGDEAHWCERRGIKHGPYAIYDPVDDKFVVEHTFRDGS